MLKRSIFFAMIVASFAFAGPAFADGTGKSPVYNAPPPLTAQPHSGFITPHASCPSSCGSSGSHYSNSGLPTNPRPSCCGHTTAAPIHHAPVQQTYAQVPVVHQTIAQTNSGLVLDAATIASMNGGVGTGVNDVFVGGGGFFGGGFAGSGFGARASGAFAGRNVALSRSLSGFRGRRGFAGGSRGGFRGGRRGGGRR